MLRLGIFNDFTRLGELDALYATHRGKFLPAPDVQELWTAGQEGMLFFAEQLRDCGPPEIVAAAGLFSVAKARHSHTAPVIEVMELAGMVIHPRLGGFGLQSAMIALRTLAVARGDTKNICLVASVADANARSVENLKASGLVDCDTPPWLQSIARTWSDSETEVLNLTVPPSAIQNHMTIISNMKTLGKIKRTNRQTQELEEIPIEFSINWLNDEMSFIEGAKNGQIQLFWETVIPKVRLVGTYPNWVEFEGSRQADVIYIKR